VEWLIPALMKNRDKQSLLHKNVGKEPIAWVMHHKWIQ